MMSSRVSDLELPLKGHNVRVNHGCHLPTPIQVHVTSKNTEFRKFEAFKRYRTQISLGMTVEIRLQIKGHSRYSLEIFREGVSLVKVRYSKFRDDRPIRSRIIL